MLRWKVAHHECRKFANDVWMPNGIFVSYAKLVYERQIDSNDMAKHIYPTCNDDGRVVTEATSLSLASTMLNYTEKQILTTYPMSQSTVSRRYSGSFSSLNVDSELPSKNKNREPGFGTH